MNLLIIETLIFILRIMKARWGDNMDKMNEYDERIDYLKQAWSDNKAN